MHDGGLVDRPGRSLTLGESARASTCAISPAHGPGHGVTTTPGLTKMLGSTVVWMAPVSWITPGSSRR